MGIKKEVTLDDVIKDLGQFSTFQFRLFLLLLPFNLCSIFYGINVMFLEESPAWYCNIPEQRISKWNHICKEEWSINLLMSIGFIGAMFGSYLFGMIADLYGRRPTYFFGVITTCVLSLCVGLSQGNYYSFAVCIFLCGFSMQGTYQVGFVLLLEFVGPDKRNLMSTMISVCGTSGYMLTPLVAYLIPNHRVLYFGLAIIFVGIALTYPFVSESPRWLLLSKQQSKLKTLLDKMAKTNQTNNTPLSLNNLFSSSESKSKKVENPGSLIQGLSLFFTVNIRSRIWICSFIWFVICSSYYGLSYSAKFLEGSIYLNVFLGGVVELPSIISAYFLLQFRGRRFSLGIMSLIISFSSFCAVPCTYFNMETLLILFALVAKCSVSGTFLILYIYTLELMPTSVRTLSLGICSIFARIGGISVPLVLAATPDRLFVFLYFSISTCLGALILMFLPETRGLPMPDSLDQLGSQSQTNNHNFLMLNSEEGENKILEGSDEQIYV